MSLTRPLRVCHVAYTFYEFDNRVRRYVEAIAARGDAVDVVTLRRAGTPWRETIDGARFYRVQRRSPNERHAWAYLLKILWFCVKATCLVSARQLRQRYDVVHVHNIPDFLVFVAWLPKLMGAKVILDIHDVVPELYAGKFERSGSGVFRTLVLMERICCLFADHVIIANHLWYDKLIRRSVPSAKCTTILNYPDLAVFKPSARKAESGNGKFLVLYPGSLNHHQGLDIAIDAFARVKPQMPDAEFHIYGRGPALEGLIQLAREKGLNGSVTFNESVGLTQIASVMASASIGVVPKRADGFGNEAFSTKILEFMGCGVPMIVSRTRVDAHYFTEDLVNFFEPGNAADLASVLLQAYQNPDQQVARVRAAREFAERHSWQVRSADYRLLVDSLANGSPCYDAAPV